MKAVLLVAVLAACGGKPSSTTTTPEASKVQEPPKALPDVPFDDLDQDQREEFMKQKVVPAMKAVFQNHDPKAYADFGCQTCHGKDAAKGRFDMPNDDLPKIGKTTDWTKFKQEDVDWMKNEVKPAMAKVMNQAEWTPENPKGFGCLECHPAAE
jgi:mono/diheme cytochrome c family protein